MDVSAELPPNLDRLYLRWSVRVLDLRLNQIRPCHRPPIGQTLRRRNQGGEFQARGQPFRLQPACLITLIIS